MAEKNFYYHDFLDGYIGIRDIPYKYWNDEIVNLAKTKDPYNYNYMLLEYTIEGLTGMTVLECVNSIPDIFKTQKFYYILLTLGGDEYRDLIPKKMYERIKTRLSKPDDFVANFKYLTESERTPLMYKQLSKLSFQDYLMYVVDYNGVPDEYRTKEMCLGLFYGNIDYYVKQIPNEYKTVELGEMLVKLNFRKYFPMLPEDCRTSEMYETFVSFNPVNNIDKVPKDKRTQKMYEMIFDYTLDTYLNKIPKEYITKEMWHRLIRIDAAKYLPLTPTKYIDGDIAACLVTTHSKYINLLPQELLTKDFFVALIKRNPLKYLKLLPEKYYTDEVFDEIYKILATRRYEYKLNAGEKLNEILISKYPELITQFTNPVISDIIIKELENMINEGKDIIDVVRKLHINSDTVMKVITKLRYHYSPLYHKLNEYLNGDRVYLRYINVDDDLKKLEKIVISLGVVSRSRITSEQKLQFAYLCNKHLTNSLEDIMAYNVSSRNKDESQIVTHFIESVLAYSCYLDLAKGKFDTKKITDNNVWLDNFNFVKFFDIKNGVATSKHFYGKDETELTVDEARIIIEKLKMEEIPLNILIVNMAFRYYFAGVFDTYIKELHSFDNVLEKPKRKKR